MNFTHLVGNTPMIRIRYKLDGREGFVWAKLEAYNLSGSIKDRLAAHVITKSTANGTLKPGQPIVENGQSAEENQVSRTSSSWCSSVLPHLEQQWGASSSTIRLPHF